MGFQILFHAPDAVLSGLFMQQAAEPLRRDPFRVGFCGDKKRFLLRIPGDQPKEAVLLPIAAYRELQVLLQGAPFRFWPFSDVKKLVVSSCRHPVLCGIQIQPSRLDGTFVPALLPEGFLGKIEGRDVPKPFFFHIRIGPKQNHRILYGLSFLKLRREPDKIPDLHRMNPFSVHQDASQKTSLLHAALQVIHPAIDAHRLAGWVPVPENLITGIRGSLNKSLRRPVCVRIFSGSVHYLLRCHKSQVFRQDA